MSSVGSTIWVPPPIIALKDLCVCSQQWPIWVDMTVYRGDSGGFWVTVHDCQDPTEFLDVRTATWNAQIKTNQDDPTPIVQLDVLPVWNTPEYWWAIGTVQVVLTAPNSELLHHDAVWDLEMSLPTSPAGSAGHVTTLVAGNVFLVKDVSR